MVDNFFSTIGGSQQDDEDDQQHSAKVSMTSGPNFVKSKATTLFTEEADILNSRHKRAKVTFAKPKAKAADAIKPTSTEENFVRKGSKVEKEKKEKLQKLEDQVQ